MSSIHPEPRLRPRLQPQPGVPEVDSQVDGSKAGVQLKAQGPSRTCNESKEEVLLQEQAVRILELEQQLRAMQEDMHLMKAAMLVRSRGGEETSRGGEETMLGRSRGGEETGGAEEGRRQGTAASLGDSIGRQLNDFEKQDTLR